MLYSNRDQLALDLCYLAKKDYSLLNDIIIEYVDLIDNKRFNDLEDVINTELQSILWVVIIHSLGPYVSLFQYVTNPWLPTSKLLWLVHEMGNHSNTFFIIDYYEHSSYSLQS